MTRDNVSLSNYDSDFESIDYGVPQGSILGPPIFILYINDLPVHLDKTHIHMYDDMMIQIFTNHLITLHLEHDQNRLVINEKKTNAMIICSFQKRRTLPHHNLNVQINGINIANVDSDKILGVYLDNNLLMNVHIDHICTKLSRLLGLLYRIRGCLSIEAKILFYNSYVQPCFDYCVTKWGFCSNTHISRFSRLQKRFARVILNNYTSPSLNLFTQLNWLNVKERIEFSTSVLVF